MPTALTWTPLASIMTGTVSSRGVIESPSTFCLPTPFLVVFLFCGVSDFSSFGVFALCLKDTLRFRAP